MHVVDGSSNPLVSNLNDKFDLIKCDTCGNALSHTDVGVKKKNELFYIVQFKGTACTDVQLSISH